MDIPNPKYGRIGESPHEPERIDIDLFDAIDEYIDAKLRGDYYGRAMDDLRAVCEEIERRLDGGASA